MPSSRSARLPSSLSLRPTSAQSKVARCQVSWPSISATEAPRWARSASLTERTTCRLPFSEWESATCSLISIRQTNANSLIQGLLDLRGLERLDHVADLDVGEAVEGDAALLALLDLAHIVLETA